MGGKPVETISVQGPSSWRLYVDGASNQRGSKVGLVVASPKKITIEKSLRLSFSATNNKIEYEEMTIVQKMGGRTVEVFSDSRLVVGQIKGELEVRHLQLGFESFTLQQIPRSKNTRADSLATLATSSAQGLPRVILVEDLCKPTGARNEKVQIHQIRVGPS